MEYAYRPSAGFKEAVEKVKHLIGEVNKIILPFPTLEAPPANGVIYPAEFLKWCARFCLKNTRGGDPKKWDKYDFAGRTQWIFKTFKKTKALSVQVTGNVLEYPTSNNTRKGKIILENGMAFLVWAYLQEKGAHNF